MRHLFVVCVLALCAAGCATASYSGPGAGQALSECQLQADMLPITNQALTNPFFVAAYQQDFINQCMQAKGYQAG